MNTLVVQRGHYPRKTGSTGTAGEQAMAVRVAKAIVKATRPGWVVRVINADEPSERYKGDAFVALHGDGSKSRSAGGASVGYRNTEGKVMGAAFKKAYLAHGWPSTFRSDNNTIDMAQYYGTGKALAVGNERTIIVEVGFLTNAKERAWIDTHSRNIAESVWDAVAGVKPVAPKRLTCIKAHGMHTHSMWISPTRGKFVIGHTYRVTGKVARGWVLLLDAAGRQVWGNLANFR